MMNLASFLRIAFLSFILTFHNANAMEDSPDSRTSRKVSIKILEYEPGEPLSVVLESENLFMRNIEGEGDLDYYFQIFCNKIAMEKYMNGIPRPANEVINRHKKYFSWWQNGNPFSSYLTFLKEDKASKFLSEQESLLESYSAHLNSFPTQKIPLKYEVLKGCQMSISALKKEFEESKKIFIGHTLLEPGDDRNLKTDAEVSYVFLPAFWGRGYGTEAVENIVEVAKELRQTKTTLESHVIDTLIATALPRNPGSCRVLEKNGFTIFKEEEKFGELRRLYTLGL
jgi:GNAT superfamily N-acetyltransferase